MKKLQNVIFILSSRLFITNEFLHIDQVVEIDQSKNYSGYIFVNYNKLNKYI